MRKLVVSGEEDRKIAALMTSGEAEGRDEWRSGGKLEAEMKQKQKKKARKESQERRKKRKKRRRRRRRRRKKKEERDWVKERGNERSSSGSAVDVGRRRWLEELKEKHFSQKSAVLIGRVGKNKR